jgi:hypothetical protein
LGRFIPACPRSPTWDLNLKFKILLLIFPGICTINKSELKQNGRRKKFLEVFRSCVMTGLLKEAFEKASMLPEEFQDEIARDLLADIHEKEDEDKAVEDNDNEWKLSWEETYREIAAEKENWDDFDIALMDGLPGEEFDSKKI